MTVVQLEGHDDLYLVDSGNHRRYLDGVSAAGYMVSLGQAKVGAVSPAVLSTYTLVGSPGPTAL